MIRLNLLLLLVVLTSALYLVHVQYESRVLFTAIDRATNESKKLAQETDTLQVEKRTQATPGRIEQLATTQLMMRPASPAITQYVTYAAAAPLTGASAPAGAKP
ncbi:MAG: Cell division protein FtsL [Burkholderiaceae bacterium]|nr:MAG: Cell division protein FtsL [Burkholderiaceae bacterium]